MKTALKTLAVGLAALAGLSAPALAREPGVPTSIPVGASMGVPIAASPPPGLYFSSRTGIADYSLYDNSGNKAGADVAVKDTAFQFLWVPGIEMLGAQYRALLTIPVLDLDQTLHAPMGSGSASRVSFGQIEVHPIDLAWELAPGIFANAGFSVFAPTGSWSASKAVNTQGNFWTFAPSLGFSYMRDGWNASVNAIYFTNTRNDDDKYKSGDEIQLHLTAMKDFGGWSVGPIGYWRKQVTDDSNDGTAYGGTIQGWAEETALGLGVSHQIGIVQANVMMTQDVEHKNTLGGPRLWLNFTVPLGQ